MKLSEAAIEVLFDSWPVARMASVDAAGHPHQVPIVFARVGDRLWSPIDGKPKGAGVPVRVRNIEGRPNVSLLLDEYAEDWSRLWWLRVDAKARVVRPTSADAPEVAAPLAALKRKYPQYGEVPILRAPLTLLSFELDRIVSWCAGDPAPFA